MTKWSSFWNHTPVGEVAYLESHDLEGVEDEPGGKAELGALGLVVVGLGLVLNLLGQNPNLIVAQPLNCNGERDTKLYNVFTATK